MPCLHGLATLVFLLLSFIQTVAHVACCVLLVVAACQQILTVEQRLTLEYYRLWPWSLKLFCQVV